METLILYAILVAAIHYLGAWAMITKPLWSRYPDWLKPGMNCAACSGFWYGAFVSLIGAYYGLDFLGISGPAQILPVALSSIVTTPPLVKLVVYSLNDLHPADEETPNDSTDA